MKKSTIEVIITAVLVVVLLTLVLTGFPKKGRKARAKGPTATSPNPKLLAQIENLKARATEADPGTRQRQAERASLPWGRDPFFAVGPEVVPEDTPKPPLVCTGVTYKEDRPVALINHAVVAEGETIGGYLVRTIMETGVVVEKGGRRYTLRIGQE